MKLMMIGSCNSCRPDFMAAVATLQDAQKRALEVATGARVYYGIHHAVAVTEPEHDLEEPGRHVAWTAQRFCVAQHADTVDLQGGPKNCTFPCD